MMAGRPVSCAASAMARSWLESEMLKCPSALPACLYSCTTSRSDFIHSLYNSYMDFLAVGDIVVDDFIRLKDANVHCNINNEDCEICMRWGDKIPYDFHEVVPAVGNASNAAVALPLIAGRELPPLPSRADAAAQKISRSKARFPAWHVSNKVRSSRKVDGQPQRRVCRCVRTHRYLFLQQRGGRAHPGAPAGTRRQRPAHATPRTGAQDRRYYRRQARRVCHRCGGSDVARTALPRPAGAV